MQQDISQIALGLAAGGAAVLLGYVLVLRPWHLRWGATREEAARALPGDEIVLRPMLTATRAITINAAPHKVWPWLVQMGYGRAGWYSYDWLDNDGAPSATRILPEWQNLKVGDVIPAGAEGGFMVAALEPNRLLLLVIREPLAQFSSLLWLEERAAGQTRLIVRLRAHFQRSLPMLLYYVLFEPGDFVLMRKMLLGIKRRAEAARQIVEEL